MDFDEWWSMQPKGPTKPITPRMAWNAATKAEREACAEICDELKSMDFCVDVRQAAYAIRKRPNVKLRD